MKNARKNIVYSTNPNFSFESDDESEEQEIPVNQQSLKIFPDRRNRKGKTVTVVSGFSGSNESLKSLEKELKSYCGTGGTTKDGEIFIQGNAVQKISDYLKAKGYRVKISGI